MEIITYYREKGGKGLRLWLNANPKAHAELIQATAGMPETSTYAERLYCAMSGNPILWKCRCGEKKRFQKLDKGFFATCGNKECEKTQKSASLKSGKHWTKKPENRHKITGKNNPEKCKQTHMERYGYEHALQNPESQKKRKETLTDRGGLTTDEIRTKKITTSMTKYGVTNPMKSDAVKNKVMESLREKYTEHAHRSAASLGLNLLNEVTENLSVFKYRCGCGYQGSLSNAAFNARVRIKESPCIKCNPPTYKSKIELELYEYIQSIAPDATSGKRFGNHELDIYIPSKNLGIEMNGLYWHSELCKDDKNYHINKKDYFEDLNINVIMVWEDDWKLKKDIVKNRLLHHLSNSGIKIGARLCEVKKPEHKDTREFLDKWHIQSAGRPASECYGLYFKDELVSLMTFIKHDTGWELLRFVSSASVSGGASKLFAAFKAEHNPGSVLCYSDRCWASRSSNVYKSMGFELVGCTEPDMSYVNPRNVMKSDETKSCVRVDEINDAIRENRLKYQRHKLAGLGFCDPDDDRSAADILGEHGIYRIYGPGSLRFEWRR